MRVARRCTYDQVMMIGSAVADDKVGFCSGNAMGECTGAGGRPSPRDEVERCIPPERAADEFRAGEISG